MQTYLTDIRDLRAVKQTIGDFKPDVIFHAAAYKHVFLQETHPRETVYNNVVGTRNLVLTAADQGWSALCWYRQTRQCGRLTSWGGKKSCRIVPCLFE